jgi:formylglycine-generating enzyme required for sulfatase activity
MSCGPLRRSLASSVFLCAALMADEQQPQAGRFIRGDADNSYHVTLTDAIRLLAQLFGGGGERFACEDAADVDDSGRIDISDPIYLLNSRFRGGPEPPPPYPTCGEDPTGDGLDCAFYDGCDPLPALANSIDMRFVWIPPGSFWRGSPPEERGRDLGLRPGRTRVPDEDPHLVRISCGFYISATEVTQGQYRAVMGLNPSESADMPRDHIHPDRAVNWVNWFEAVDFTRALNRRDELARELGMYYRLPTEAEWEYACRAGTGSRYWFGDALECSDFQDDGPCPTFKRFMQYNATDESIPPGFPAVRPANPWGLFDMHGNVAEWCLDWYGPYPREEVRDPPGPPSGNDKVARGNAIVQPHLGRSAARNPWRPDSRALNSGFRVILGGCHPPNLVLTR